MMPFWAKGVSSPLAVSAEYYLSRQDYRQAFQLWSLVLKQNARDTEAIAHVGELKLLFEGRKAARDAMLEFLKVNTLSPEAKEFLRAKLSVTQSRFLTDNGQTLFLQALTKARKENCSGAIALFNSAADMEQGNVAVLKEKARCELAQLSIDAHYATLKSAHENDPFDMELLELISEAHVYHGQFEPVVLYYQSYPDLLRSDRQRVAYAVALAENGSKKLALAQLQGLIEPDRHRNVVPIVYYYLGKLLHDEPDQSEPFLERFIALSLAGGKNQTVLRWDPYRKKERVEQAQALLTSFRGPRL